MAKIYKVVKLNEGSNLVNLDIKQQDEKIRKEYLQHNKVWASDIMGAIQNSILVIVTSESEIKL